MKKINKNLKRRRSEKAETVCQILTSNYNYEYMEKDETLLSIANTNPLLQEHILVFDLNEEEVLSYLIMWLKGTVLDADTKDYISLRVNTVISDVNDQTKKKKP